MRWKRLLAVGCSHGYHIDPKAETAILTFRERFKPHTVFHLGDFCDMTAWRSGARGTADEAEPIRPDIEGRLRFLRKLRPTHVLCGNHEDRIYRLRHHYSAIISELAQQTVAEIEKACALLRAELHPWKYKQGVRIGDYLFCHGIVYNETAARDMAEMFGSVVFAHTHQAAFAKGRRSDNPSGYCVGTLAAIDAMDYAKSRRKTLAWSGGFVWGEYCEDRCQLWLHENGQNQEWLLPPV